MSDQTHASLTETYKHRNECRTHDFTAATCKNQAKKKTQRSEMTNNFQKQHRAGNIPIISTKPTN
jgi:hypothetical protein